MHRAPLTLEQIAAGLARFVRAECSVDGSIEHLRVMEAGHAGLTFGFDLVGSGWQPHRDAGPAPAQRRGLILKLAPPGVRRAGNTDVYRQTPLLRALHRAGLPVPDVPFASEDEAWFGTPFILMERLAGEPFFVWQPDAAFDRSDAAVAPLWTQTIDAMIALHRFDWQRHLPDWEAPRPLRDEINYWDPILAKAPDAGWVAQGRTVCQRLLARLPQHVPIGLVHGDCQPGNALFDRGRLTGLIDWELASIGSRWLDVGWMMMLADHASWLDGWRPLCPLTPAQIAARYCLAMGERDEHLPWFQAFASYRLGAIACLNVHLHRSGRRRDPTWEQFAGAIPCLFGRAHALLENPPAPSGVRR